MLQRIAYEFEIPVLRRRRLPPLFRQSTTPLLQLVRGPDEHVLLRPLDAEVGSELFLVRAPVLTPVVVAVVYRGLLANCLRALSLPNHGLCPHLHHVPGDLRPTSLGVCREIREGVRLHAGEANVHATASPLRVRSRRRRTRIDVLWSGSRVTVSCLKEASRPDRVDLRVLHIAHVLARGPRYATASPASAHSPRRPGPLGRRPTTPRLGRGVAAHLL